MTNNKKIKRTEMLFGFYKNMNGVDQYNIVELITYEDGTKEKKLKTLRDIERPYWLTKPSERDYVDKKEWIDLDRVDRFTCRQCDLYNKLGKDPHPMKDFRDYKSKTNPYVFGSDINPLALLKEKYNKDNDGEFTPFRVAGLDSETDVVNGTEETIMATLVFEDVYIISVLDDWCKEIPRVEENFKRACKKYIPEYIEGKKIEFYTRPNTFELWKVIFKRLHELQPDIVSIWNVDYDVPKILEACKSKFIDPKYLFSDPSVRKHEKYFNYSKGPTKKITSSGKETPIDITSQWHSVLAPASFRIIDGMSAYAMMRPGKKIKVNLDDTLDRELGIRKLKFKEADNYKKLAKHIFMQKNYKLEYMVYGLFDPISLVELDNKTKDLSISLPLLCNNSDFTIFNSQPTMVGEKLHAFALKNNKVLGTGGIQKNYIPALPVNKLWILNLPTTYMNSKGSKILKHRSEVECIYRTLIAGIDCVSSYPRNIQGLNISKETAKSEIATFHYGDMLKNTQVNMDLMSGHSGSLNYTRHVHEIKLDDILTSYEQSL